MIQHSVICLGVILGTFGVVEDGTDTLHIHLPEPDEHNNEIKGIASWYSIESCKREGTSGIWTANGERFNENDLTCAMPHKELIGKSFLVTSAKTGKSIVLRCNDLGPNKKLNRVCDLPKGIFAHLSNNRLDWGLMEVTVKEMKQ